MTVLSRRQLAARRLELGEVGRGGRPRGRLALREKIARAIETRLRSIAIGERGIP